MAPRTLPFAAVCLLATACSAAHTPETIEARPPSVTGTPPTLADRLSPLESCLLAGGLLEELEVVDNNDVVDHGALHTLAVSEGGTLAVAGEDGTLKFWTLSDGLLGSVSSSLLTYGAEAPTAVTADLAFLDEEAVAGDVRGVVASWTAEGAMRILGGTSPDVAITAVATRGGTLAHADAQPGGNVMVRDVAGTDVVGPLDTALSSVADLAYLPDGGLLLAGALGETRAALELRDAADPTRVTSAYLPDDGAPIREVSVSSDGRVVAAVGQGYLLVLDGALDGARVERLGAHDPVSVAATPHGRVVLTAGAEGDVVARVAGSDADELGRAFVPEPVIVRLDATGALAFVGSRRGTVHVLGCTP